LRILFFGAAIILIKVSAVALAEEASPGK